MWNLINKQRGQQAGHRPASADLTPDDLNTFFVNIASNIQTSIKPSEIDPVNNISVRQLPQNKFLFTDVSIIEVRDTIFSLKNKKYKDPYGFTVDLLKTIANLIVVPLTRLINDCFRKNLFPTLLKRAIVVPIFKEGDADDAANYRPISLLPVISKVFESCMASRITGYFEAHKLFTDDQYGFRKGRNTTQAVLHFVENILDAFARNERAAGVFCDMSKAFDCVSHDLLLEKLKAYNFHQNSVNMIKSYLQNRVQTVCFNGAWSVERGIRIGVPQGSILGPLLFLIYINDLPNIDADVRYTIFADDTSLAVRSCSAIDCIRRSSEAQSLAESWTAANKLFLNKAKTKTLEFFAGNAGPGDRISVRFLGVLIDPQLRWDIHIDCLFKKLSSTLYLLRKLSNCLSKDVIKQAYYALFHSKMSYAILVWGHACNTSLIFGLQRKAIRIMQGLKYRDDCRSSFRDLQILTLPSLYIFENLIYIKKHINLYKQHIDIHSHDTRGKNRYVPSYCRINRCQNGPGYLAIKFFNKLPRFLTELPDNLFKRKLKCLLLEGAFYSFDEFLQCNFTDYKL